MRIYLPGTVADLVSLRESNECQIAVGFAVNAQWAKAQPDDDAEVLEDELLTMAAGASLANGAAASRIVIVAEADGQWVSPDSIEVTLSSPLNKRQIAAFFADDQPAQAMIAAGNDPIDEDLLWFGPSELDNLLDLVGH